jgi:PAS domain-containing protein
MHYVDTYGLTCTCEAGRYGKRCWALVAALGYEDWRRRQQAQAAHFYLDGTLDRPVVGYIDGSRWNGWATPVFDRDTAMQVMTAVNDANEGEDDQSSISYDADRDAFLIHEPMHPDEGPEVVPGYDVDVDGQHRHVYALGTRAWRWVTWDQERGATKSMAERVTGQLQAVLDVLPIGVFITDAAGHLLRCNAAAVAIWGEARAAGRAGDTGANRG